MLHLVLNRCSCLLSTCRLLGADRKNLQQSCRLVPLHIHGINLSWAYTAAPHSLCSWVVLPLILRVGILELPRIPTPSFFPHLTWCTHYLFYKENRSDCIGSPLFPYTISANLSSSHLSLLLPELLSHWNSYPSCSQTNLTTCAQLLLRDLFPSVIPSLGCSVFPLIVFAPAA